jgi:hypothetical protein
MWHRILRNHSSSLEKFGLPSTVISQYSVPHAIIKYRCPPEFVYLYREFGGDLILKDDQGRLATEIAENSPALQIMKTLQDHPLSLQSLCRLSIRQHVGSHRFSQIKNLSMNNQEIDENGLAPYLVDFLEYRQMFLSVGQLPESNCWNNVTHTNAIKRLGNVMREVVSDGPIIRPMHSLQLHSKQRHLARDNFNTLNGTLHNIPYAKKWNLHKLYIIHI